jgi:type I restriction enzyme M protein
MARGQPRKNSDTPNSEEQKNHATLERDLFLSADKLRKNLEPSDYKHVVLG